MRLLVHDALVKKLLASVDEDFAQIDKLLRELRNRIARASEAVHVVAEKAVKPGGHRRKAAKKTTARR